MWKKLKQNYYKLKWNIYGQLVYTEAWSLPTVLIPPILKSGPMALLIIRQYLICSSLPHEPRTPQSNCPIYLGYLKSRCLWNLDACGCYDLSFLLLFSPFSSTYILQLKEYVAILARPKAMANDKEFHWTTVSLDPRVNSSFHQFNVTSFNIYIIIYIQLLFSY